MEPNDQIILQTLKLLSYPGKSNQLLNPAHLFDIFKDLIALDSDHAVSLLLDYIAHTYRAIAQRQG